MIGDKITREGFVENPVLGLNKLPWLPIGFQISRYGGLVRSDLRRWFTNLSESGMSILYGRYFQMSNEQRKAFPNVKQFAILNGWIQVGYNQSRAIHKFDIESSAKREVVFRVYSDTLKDKRAIQVIMSIAQEYYTFFEQKLKTHPNLWFSVYWLKPELQNGKVVFERRTCNNINTLFNILKAGYKTKAAQNDKLQSVMPKFVKSNVEETDEIDSNDITDIPDFEFDVKETEAELNESQRIYNINSNVKSNVKASSIVTEYLNEAVKKSKHKKEKADTTQFDADNIYTFNTDEDKITINIDKQPDPIGCISCVNRCIKGLWVNPEYRNKGLASKLMTMAVSKFNPELIRPQPYSTNPITGKKESIGMTKEQLINFYSKFGFKDIGNNIMKR